jgi:prophage regulatory protein
MPGGGNTPKAPIRILRLPEVINRVGLKRASIYAAIARGTFPKQIPLGARAVGWIEGEIEAWLAARIRKMIDSTR